MNELNRKKFNYIEKGIFYTRRCIRCNICFKTPCRTSQICLNCRSLKHNSKYINSPPPIINKRKESLIKKYKKIENEVNLILQTNTDRETIRKKIQKAWRFTI